MGWEGWELLELFYLLFFVFGNLEFMVLSGCEYGARKEDKGCLLKDYELHQK
jgi:hypothetical protein